MSDRRDEDGFTLIELVISVAVLTIIIGAISGALMTFLVNGTYTTQRDDHSGGASVLSAYLDRDLASADLRTPAGTPCSGGGTNAFTLSWSEFTATPTSPTPAVSATWRASYVVSTDTTVPAGTGTRYQLTRVLCPPSGTVERTLLLQNLKAPGPAQVVEINAGSTAVCGLPAESVEVRLPSYADDATSGFYSYVGCVRGRTT